MKGKIMLLISLSLCMVMFVGAYLDNKRWGVQPLEKYYFSLSLLYEKKNSHPTNPLKFLRNCSTILKVSCGPGVLKLLLQY